MSAYQAKVTDSPRKLDIILSELQREVMNTAKYVDELYSFGHRLLQEEIPANGSDTNKCPEVSGKIPDLHRVVLDISYLNAKLDGLVNKLNDLA